MGWYKGFALGLGVVLSCMVRRRGVEDLVLDSISGAIYLFCIFGRFGTMR
jgi:hypothetical protein